MSESGWIGVDLDGTLAHYAGWKGPDHIGAPIKPMVDRVKAWLAEGVEVRIVTARVAATGEIVTVGGLGTSDDNNFAKQQTKLIEDWCREHIGQPLKVTASKDFAMVELWDDRAIRVEMNTGRILSHEPNPSGSPTV